MAKAMYRIKDLFEAYDYKGLECMTTMAWSMAAVRQSWDWNSS